VHAVEDIGHLPPEDELAPVSRDRGLSAPSIGLELFRVFHIDMDNDKCAHSCLL
tara:strand:+ start:2263 stop:2424 length:162 start_codon:yes stop_codon:yes gene_type:complete